MGGLGYCARVADKNFKILFCERFGYPISKYQAAAFKKCLYGRAKLIAPLIRILDRNFFAQDLKFIQILGESRHAEEARSDLLDFQDANLAGKPYLRRRLKLRVSGRKAIELARTVFSEAERV